ncbi:MAG TPA: hypothetical protein VHJ17_23715 [Thermomonospora sp.]|nr:hypothetical protein [Thermomonospora sp.]
MNGGWAVLLSTGGGALATILGVVIGGLLGRRGEERKWVRDTRVEAFVTFLQEYVALEIELREAYNARRPDTADWKSYNASLATLSLIAPREVSAAVEPMNQAVRDMLVLADAPVIDHAEYERVHTAMLRAYLAFVNAARHSLDRRNQPLESLVGGPPPWHMVRRWLPDPSGER